MDGKVGSVFGESETSQAGHRRSGGAISIRTALPNAVRAHPTAAALVALAGLATTSAAFHSLLVGWVHGPKVFMDELGYERMALSFAHSGQFSLFGKSGFAYSPLYPIVLSPIYALTSVHAAYEWAKDENTVLLSLSVFPVYGIARFVLPRGPSLGVAALSLVAPLMFYSGLEMSESLAYPVCLVAIWTMLRALRGPSVANDAVLLAAVAVASATRLQLIVLLPAALTAVVLVALVHPESTRSRSVLRAALRHRLLFGAAGLVLVAGLVRTVMNAGNLPLAGRYANLGSSHASPLRVVELGVQHLAELDLAVGVIPFAAALLAGYALVRYGFPRKALVFAAVAVASAAWLLLEVAYDAAAFDATSARTRGGIGAPDAPRIHERYLIYLVPFFLVALFVALPLLRGRFSARRHLAIAAVAAALPVFIPFGMVINNTSIFESPGLQAFGKIADGKLIPAPHATLVALILSALLAFGYIRAAARLPSLAISMTLVALVGMSALVFDRQAIPSGRGVLGLPSHKDWVDRAMVRRSGGVTLVGGAGVRAIPVDETAFWNSSVTRVYHTCGSGFGTDYGDRRLTMSGTQGTLIGPNGTMRTRYAVVPTRLHVRGRVLARDPEGKLELLAPAGGRLEVPPAGRSTLRCQA